MYLHTYLYIARIEFTVVTSNVNNHFVLSSSLLSISRLDHFVRLYKCSDTTHKRIKCACKMYVRYISQVMRSRIAL